MGKYLALAAVLIFSLLAQAATGQSSAAPSRLALVFGNANYVEGLAVPNATVDSANVARVLRGNGFRVIPADNATGRQMRDRLREFAEEARRLPAGSIALVYYAGHGLSSNDVNYLVPVDAPAIRASNIDRVGIPLSEVIAALPANTEVSSFLIVDACRSVPLPLRDRLLSYGFVREDPPVNTLISFSTSQGSEASDGVAGAGSPYAVGLVRELEYSHGILAEDMFREVRRFVQTTTEGAQLPIDYSSLVRQVSLNSNAASPRDRRTYYARNLIADGAHEEGLEFARRSAEEGDVNAMRIMVDAYAIGRGARIDHRRAIDWAEKAARLGNDEDKVYAANLILTWQPRAPNARASWQTLTRLAAQNNPHANYYLAHHYQRRGGTLLPHSPNADWATAATYYQRAAERGLGAAGVNLGVLYQMGAGVRHDMQQAERWYRIAAEAGITRGMTRLGGVLSTLGTRRRLRERDEEAIYWYRRAETAGDPEARYRLGLHYYFGIGVAPDRDRALTLLRQVQRLAGNEGTGVPANMTDIIRAVQEDTLEEPLLDPSSNNSPRPR